MATKESFQTRFTINAKLISRIFPSKIAKWPFMQRLGLISMDPSPPLRLPYHQMKTNPKHGLQLLDFLPPHSIAAREPEPLNRFNGAVSQGKPRLGLLIRLHEQITLWGQRMRERRMLAQMDSRLLRDIGLSSIDASRESSKPFWRK